MRRSLAWCTAALMSFGVSAMGTLGESAALAATWGENYFPNLPVVTQDGQTLRFYDDLIKNKIVVIDFIYTSCPDFCSLMTARMARVQELLGDRVGRDIFMYSISLDPERDSPEALRTYADAFHVRPGWLFLTGKPEDLHMIRYKLGERSRRLSEHRSTIVLGNATTGEWTRSSVFKDIERIALEIREMDPAWRAQPRVVANYANATVASIDGKPGQALFAKACASCHTVGNGDFVGPDLRGVTARRDRGWLVRYMMDPEQLRLQKDPIAVDLATRYKGVPMPYLGLSESDVADLLAYVEVRTNLLGTVTRTDEPPHD